jgi:hypothetical protein
MFIKTYCFVMFEQNARCSVLTSKAPCLTRKPNLPTSFTVQYHLKETSTLVLLTSGN